MGASQHEVLDNTLRDRRLSDEFRIRKAGSRIRKCNQGAAGAAGGAATATTNSNMATQEVATDGHGVVEVEPHHQFSYASTARLEPVRLSTAGYSGVQRGPRGTDGERCVKWRC